MLGLDPQTPQALDFDVAVMMRGDQSEMDAYEKVKAESADGSDDAKAVDAESLGSAMMRF